MELTNLKATLVEREAQSAAAEAKLRQQLEAASLDANAVNKQLADKLAYVDELEAKLVESTNANVSSSQVI